MTNEHKLVALCAFLPVMADFIDDLNDQTIFKRTLKQKANILVEEIRRTDAKILQVTESNSMEIFSQQVELQIIFREWIKTEITF